MIVHIPMDVVEEAIKDAQEDLGTEVIGFFVARRMDHEQGAGQSPYRTEWMKMSNVSALPHLSSEVAAEDIVRMIINQGCIPVAMFHSHPSGDNSPSDHDVEFFPREYVTRGLIWSHTQPHVVRMYRPSGVAHDCFIDQVFVSAEA